jgi:hypothetical protein
LALAGALIVGSLAVIFTNMAESSVVLSPAEAQLVATGLEEDRS